MKKLVIALLCIAVILGAVSLFLFRNNTQIKNDNKDTVTVTPDSESSENKDTLLQNTDFILDLETGVSDAVLIEIGKAEYQRLIKDSCNVRLSLDSTKFKDTEDSLTIFTDKRDITLLNLPYDEDVASDFCINWGYDGFEPKNKLSFFSYGGFENWGYYAVNNLGGVSEFYANQPPVFCRGTNLFATCFEDPYQGISTLNVYKILSDGRLSEIAAVELGESNTARNFVWVRKNVLVAEKLMVDKDRPIYIRLYLTGKALNNNIPFHIEDSYEYEYYNNLVKELIDRRKTINHDDDSTL